MNKKTEEIIFLRDFLPWGKKYEKKSLAGGFARKLLADGAARLASSEAQLWAEQARKKEIELKRKRRESALAEKEKLDGILLSFSLTRTKKGSLFGSISTKEIVEALRERGFTIGKDQLRNFHPLKVLGESTVRVHLGENIDANLLVKIV